MSVQPRLIAAHIDDAPLKGLVLRVTLLCALMLAIEGMDTNSISYVGSFISRDNHIPLALMGWIYSATVAASLVGAAGVAPFSDRIGRRTILVWASLILSIATALTPFAHVFPVLIALRVIVGIAFGAAVPCAFALTADYAPKGRRALLMIITTSGVAFGSVITGLCAAVVVARLGWPALMYLAGGVSFFFTLLLMWRLPESISFLLHRRPGSPATARVLKDIGVEPSAVAAPAVVEPHSSTPMALFVKGRARVTLTILAAITCAYVVEFLLSYWMPTMLMHGGARIQDASLITAAAKSASIVGGILVGLCMDRFGLRPTLAKTFLAAAVVIGLLSLSMGAPAIAVGFVIAGNFFVDGSFSGSQALVASAYPPEIRGTATGWITGLGRLVGGGTGTAAGGYLLSSGWRLDQVCILLAVVMAVGALAILALILVDGPQRVARGPSKARLAGG